MDSINAVFSPTEVAVNQQYTPSATSFSPSEKRCEVKLIACWDGGKSVDSQTMCEIKFWNLKWHKFELGRKYRVIVLEEQ